MIDKKKQLENLEKKYEEIKKLNFEVSSIIDNIKNDVEINRENKLLEEKKVLEKKFDSISEALKLKEKELENIKNTNSVLVEELKETKKAKRNDEINKFNAMVANKINAELDNGITKKLNDYSKNMFLNVKKINNTLENDFSNEASELKKELQSFKAKIEIFLKNKSEKTEEQKKYLLENSSVFHNKIKEEAKLKEGDFLFEKEKTKFVYEKFIGLKGFNFLGIISIFLGVFLVFRTQFVKIFSNNYIKSTSAYLLGVIFLFLGEKLYQKNKKQFAVGLIGGGIGILYLTTLISTLMLKLFPMSLGLLISLILTVLVIILSLRYNNQVIGILSLIGGYLPYGAYIWINKSNIQIYYLLVYSLILQGTVLAISWKKDWVVNKIFGFVIGTFNMIGLVYYLKERLNNKILAFIYIVIFTTAYSFIFLNSHKKEKRKSDIIDYIFLSLNLIVKFSLINSLSDSSTPTWLKATFIGGIGIIYLFLGDRLKENRVSKIFYIVSLGAFILIIPLIVPRSYIALAWGIEAILLYYLHKKYKNKELKYGFLLIYIIALFSGFGIRDDRYFLSYIQDLIIIALSFSVYFMIKQNSYKSSINMFVGIFKYIIFVYCIFFVSRLFGEIVFMLNIKLLNERYSLVENRTLISMPIVVYILRKCTYKIKKLQDKFSLKFLVIVEILYLLCVNAFNMVWNMKYDPVTSISYIDTGYIVGLILLIIANIVLFIMTRVDLHFEIFKKEEKHYLWVLGEMLYILFVSYNIMNTLKLTGAGLYLNIIGLLICIYLVWKGFRTPNRNIRRIGLCIGVFFVLKSFVVDFLQFDNSYRLVAYFVMGAILIATSYIYQNALKNLDKMLKDEIEKNSLKETIKNEKITNSNTIHNENIKENVNSKTTNNENIETNINNRTMQDKNIENENISSKIKNNENGENNEENK